MAEYLSPGVYVEEFPSDSTIQGVPTSVAAFVGDTETGPINQPTLVTSWADFERRFGTMAWFGFTACAVFEFFSEGGSSCCVVRTPGNGKAATALLGNIKLAAASPGRWGDSLMAYVCNAQGDADANPAPAPTPAFSLKVVVDAAAIDAASSKSDLATQLLAAFVRRNSIGTTLLGGKPFYVLETFGGLTEASLENGDLTTRINATSMFIRVSVADGKVARPANTAAPVAFSGGAAAAYTYMDSVNTLQQVQGISLLALPDTPAITDSSGKSDLAKQGAVINQTQQFCENQASLFYVCDPPFDLSVPDIRAFTAGSGANTVALNSSYAAIYYPWLWMHNPVADMIVPIPPSGPVLGRYAYTDANAGVFKSPAGVNDGALRTIVAVNRQLTDADHDNLNPFGINAIRSLVNYGNVIWGARTLSQDPSWTYVCVRRLFIYVEQTLRGNLQWVAFQPNDQNLWSTVSLAISTFLTNLWRQGGLFGATASEAFFVTCDATNNPPEMRQLGQLHVDIGLAPVFPAEFIVIRIILNAAAPD